MITIRPARLEDAEAIARVHVQAWRETYRGIVPDDFLAGLSVEKRRLQHEGSIGAGGHRVAEENGQIVGFMCCGPERDPPNPDKGELYAIYLLDRVTGKGIGKKLLQQSVAHLTAQGFGQMSLWVVNDNACAKSFYEAMGGLTDGATKNVLFAGKEVMEIRYIWTLTSPVPA